MRNEEILLHVTSFYECKFCFKYQPVDITVFNNARDNGFS